MEAEIKLFLSPGSCFAHLGEESNRTVFEIYWYSLRSLDFEWSFS